MRTSILTRTGNDPEYGFGFRCGRGWLAPVFCLGLLASAGCSGLMEETVEEEPAKPQSELPPPEPFVTLSATRLNKLINVFGQETRSKTKIYRDKLRVRTESTESDPREISIFDYEASKEFRLQEGDHIYFEIEIGDNLYERAQREGLIPVQPNPEIETTRIGLGERTINGHPTEIILLVQKRDVKVRGMDFIKYDYTVRFEALDLERQPVRVAYNQTSRILVVVDYHDIQTRIDDLSILQVPKDYMSFTPY